MRPEADRVIILSVAGPAALERDEIIVSVPADDSDTAVLEDANGADNAVAENSPVDTEVGITARSPAASTYTLSDSAGGLFAIDPQSGAVSVAMAMLDHEALSSHTITVRASSATESRTVAFVIQVTDVDEPIKAIADIDFNSNKIALGSKSGDTVGITARAIDPDRGAAVTYTLSQNPQSLFAVNPQSGVVTLASNNYSPDQDYLIEVAAGSDDNTSSAAQFTVRRDEPIRIVPSPTTPTVREGESRLIAFSFAETDLEFKAIAAGGFPQLRRHRRQ